MHVLFLTDNKAFFDPNGTQRIYLNALRGAAEALHIVVCTKRGDGLEITQLDDHTWVYPTRSFAKILYVFDLLRLSRFQLLWQGEFRAHIIYSDNPGAAGIAGALLARWYERVWIVNVRRFVWHNAGLFGSLASVPLHYMLAHAHRICVTTDLTQVYLAHRARARQREKIIKLPVMHEVQIKDGPTEDLKSTYPEFGYILLTASSLGSSSQVSLAVDIINTVHKHPNFQHAKAGLVIVGDGPFKAAVSVRTKLLGIGEWVKFAPQPESFTGFARDANAFIYLAEGDEDAEVLLAVAAEHCPLIAMRSTVSEHIISHGNNGYLISERNPQKFLEALVRLNEVPGLREQFRLNSDAQLLKETKLNEKQLSEFISQMWNYEVASEEPYTMPNLHPHSLKKRPPNVWDKFREGLHQMYPTVFPAILDPENPKQLKP